METICSLCDVRRPKSLGLRLPVPIQLSSTVQAMSFMVISVRTALNFKLIRAALNRDFGAKL